MATYRVVPLPDGVSKRYGWQVKKGGRRVSKHDTKSGAKRKAKRKASSGDSIVIHKMNGQVQRSVTA